MQKQVSFERRFKQFTDRVHTDIACKYIEGCIHWVNTLYDDGWFEATERLERRLIQLRDGKIDIDTFNIEEEIFFEKIGEYMQKYRRYKKLDDEQSLLKSFIQGDNL